MDKIFFLHIPKAGGTTMTHVFMKNFRKDEIFIVEPKNPIGNYQALDAEQKKNIKVIEGHFTFGLHEEIGEKPRYITFLREPIDRIISYYYYVKKCRGHYIYDYGQKLSLKDFVSNGISIEMDNDQTRYISGIRNIPFGSCNNEMLEKAKKNLVKHFEVTGITELFDEALVLSKILFGLKDIRYEIQNKTRQRPAIEQVDKETLEVIKAHNQLDLQLYDFAKAELLKKIESHQNEFRSHLSRFRLQQKIYKLYTGLKKSIG